MKMLKRWLRGFKKSFDHHTLFWLALCIGAVIFYYVPQIANVWLQAPPDGTGIPLKVGYWVFVVGITAFYVGSLFVVLGHRPIEWILDEFGHWPWVAKLLGVVGIVPHICSEWMVRAVSREPKRSKDDQAVAETPPTENAPAVPDKADQTTADASPPREVLTLPPPGRILRRGFVWAGLALVGLAALMLWIGAAGDGSRFYPLAGAGCRTFSALCLLLGLWLLTQAAMRHWGIKTEEMTALDYAQARILGWFFATWLAGEALWFLASGETLGHLFSYRMYTIWAAVHSLALLILLALLTDRWHIESRWPARLVLALILIGVAWWWSGAAPLSSEDFRSHLSAKQRDTPCPDDDRARHCARSEGWFSLLAQRVESIKDGEGPVVLVAASGGGSRAAIFTALALDTFVRTPIYPGAPILSGHENPKKVRTWADNIVLVSSVSGGSLATAHHVHGLRPGTFPSEVDHLRNTTKRELVHRIMERVLAKVDESRRSAQSWPGGLRIPKPGPKGPEEEYLTELEEFEGQLTALNGTEQQLRDREELLSDLWSEVYWLLLDRAKGDEGLLQDFFERSSKLSRYRWVLRQPGVDAMCMDFMAPILRGSLTPLQDRGDSLARFWTERFGWHDSTNFNGYGGALGEWTDEHQRPLVIFNASQVGKGSRLAIGFPAMPHDLWRNVYDLRNVNKPDKRAGGATTKLERPWTLGEVNPSLRLCLARAVRLSSNFPFGFRVVGLPSDAGEPMAARVLDGGVVDNTGLDTLYHLFDALEFYAKDEYAERFPKYHDYSHQILDGMRRRGVLILEIDSGAKPSRKVQDGPHAGLAEPLQGMNNAAYTNAELTKRLYLDEIKRILTRNLDDLDSEDEDWVSQSLSSFRERLPQHSSVLHVAFQCNHYATDQDSPTSSAARKQDVMTAWTLGPADKAEVVARFLLELGLWDDDKRPTIHKGFEKSRAGYQWLHARAAETIKQQRVELMVREIQKRLRGVARTLEALAEALKDPKPKTDTLDRVQIELEKVAKEIRAGKVDQRRLAQAIQGLKQPKDYFGDAERLDGDLTQIDNRLDVLRATKETIRGESVRSLAEASRRTNQALQGLGDRLALPPADPGGHPTQSILDIQRELDGKAQSARQYSEKAPSIPKK